MVPPRDLFGHCRIRYRPAEVAISLRKARKECAILVQHPHLGAGRKAQPRNALVEPVQPLSGDHEKPDVPRLAQGRICNGQDGLAAHSPDHVIADGKLLGFHGPLEVRAKGKVGRFVYRR